MRMRHNVAIGLLRGESVVTTRVWALFLACITTMLLFSGCGEPTTRVQNEHAPVSSAPNVSIQFQPAPPGSIFLNGSASFGAVVSNDSSNAGVDWNLTCQVDNCGSLIPRHTDSGKMATYQPPQSISGNTQVVTIVGYAAADPAANITTQITVSGFARNLKGNYVFQTRGVDASGPSQMAGVMVIDGKGGITSGEQTYSNSLMSVSDSITGGRYSIGPDGRGTITVITADQNIGQQGAENFSFVLLSTSQAFLAQVDDPNIQATSSTTSSGTLELQSPAPIPKGGYAFVVNGTDPFLNALAFGGVINVDSPGTISGAGSVADEDLAGALTTDATLSGTVSSADTFGMIKFTLSVSFLSSPMELTGYIVDGSHIRLVESDNTSGAGVGATAGLAISQGAATGTFTNNNAFAGTYVFSVFGHNLSGPGSAGTLFSSVGMFTADALGNLTNGFSDEFSAGFVTPVSDSFTGTYTLDSSGTGRIDTNFSISFANTGPGPELIFYLTGTGSPPLILDADPNLDAIGALGTGLASPAAANPSFNGRYGISFTQFVAAGEDDASGEVNVNANSQTLSGVVDTNFLFTPQPNTSLTGGFAASSTANRFTGSLNNGFFLNTSGPIQVAYYLIDSNHGVFVETDSFFTSGLFTTRSPVCPGCP